MRASKYFSINDAMLLLNVDSSLLLLFVRNIHKYTKILLTIIYKMLIYGKQWSAKEEASERQPSF